MRRRPVRFKPNWKLGVFTLLMFPLLMGMGLWQLAREEEKRALLETFEERRAAEPAPLRELDPGADLRYRRVTMTGHYDNERSFLLDNRIHEGQPGFEVISPFTTDRGTTVLVNRGWLPLGASRGELPAIPAVSASVAIAGHVHVPLGERLMLGDPAPFDGWPHVIQTLDTQAMYEHLGRSGNAAESFPYTVRLAEESPGVLTRNWQVVTLSPERHRGYAIQWFTMAAVLVGLFVYASARRPTDPDFMDQDTGHTQ